MRIVEIHRVHERVDRTDGAKEYRDIDGMGTAEKPGVLGVCCNF